MKTVPRKKVPKFTSQDWKDIYAALMDAAETYHSGPRADRVIEIARKIREGLF